MHAMFAILLLFGVAMCAELPRIKLHRDVQGHWHFAREGTPLPYVIGWNHFHKLTDPCPSGDTECEAADLFEKSYQANASLAALSALPRFRNLAFTGGGYDSVPSEHMSQFPFLRSMFLFSANSWNANPRFDDPWDLQVLSSIDKKINRSCAVVRPYRQNVLGYIFNDALAYNVETSQKVHGNDWVSTLRCLDRSAPGRQQYEAFLRARYEDDVEALCSAYGLETTSCQSWTSLDLCPLNNTQVSVIMQDDQAFMPILADQIFSHVSTSLRKCDPDATLLGDNFGLSDGVPYDIISVMTKYADAITVQFGLSSFKDTYLPTLHDKFGDMPIVVADMGFAFPHPPYERYEWPAFQSQEKAGEVYQDFLLAAVQSGYVVAVNKCGYIDRIQAQPHVALKPGLLDFNGSFHEPISSLIRAANMAAQDAFRSQLAVV